jgi:Tfp pilus assembly protein PilV
MSTASTTSAAIGFHARASQQGSTLSEVLLAILVFALFSFGMMGVLGQSASLNSRDREVNQSTLLAQGLVEQLVMVSREVNGYQTTVSKGYTQCADPDFVYALDVSETIPGTKKVSVMLYYHDRADGSPISVDPRRVNQGLAICLSTIVEKP